MRKSTVLAITSMMILGFAANAFAADLFGYPVVEKQLRFYSLIFGIIGLSVVMVTLSCLFSKQSEAKKRSRKLSGAKAFGRLVAATQPAK